MNVLLKLADLKLNTTDIGYDVGPGRDSGTGLLYLLNAVYMWAGIIAVVVIIFAGFLFVTSRGDASQMKRSKDAIRGAVIGLIVVMLAFVLTRFIIGGVRG